MRIYDLMEILEAKGIFFQIINTRKSSITVCLAVPGERWEVDFFEDGDIEVEIFKSSGEILDRTSLDALLVNLEA